MTSKEIYIDHCQSNQKTPVFAQAWWLDEVCDEWEVALTIEEGEITAAFPYSLEKKLSLKLIRNPLLTPYMGPIFFKETIDQATLLPQLWEQIPHYDSFEVQGYPQQEIGLSEFYTQKGFQANKRITYLLDLEKSSSELILAGMHSNHRNLIRQAAKVHQCQTGAAYIDCLAQMHHATYKKKGLRYPYPSALLPRLMQLAIDRQQGQIFVSKTETEEITAGVFILWDKRCAYLLLSAGAGAHHGAVRLLIYEAMQFAKVQGIPLFDFEGSMDPGIAAFFRRFGGTKKDYWEWKHYPSLIWRLKRKYLG